MSPTPARPGSRSRARGVVAVVAVVFAAGVLLGPRARVDDRWSEPDLPADVSRLAAADQAIADLRPGDGREVVWADGVVGRRTALGLVYLHGFSADRHELEPVISDVARELGANVYFTRLRGHGRSGEAMAEASADAWLDDTAEAVAVGARIAERVVLVGTSTGGTLATWAAARAEARDRVAALVLVSPNFHPKDRSARILLYPWGGVLARLVVGAERCFEAENAQQERHWTTCYPTGALSAMMALVEHVRTADLSGLVAPTLVLYSPDDGVVDAAETVRVIERFGTTPRVHRALRSSDPMRHVLAGDIVSPASNDEVRGAILRFLADVFGERSEVAR